MGVQGAIFLGIVGVALFVEGAAYLPCLIDRAVHLVIGLPGAENGNIIVQPLAGDQPPQRIVAVEVGGATGPHDPVAYLCYLFTISLVLGICTRVKRFTT